jgi:hypothetical protein
VLVEGAPGFYMPPPPRPPREIAVFG